MDERQDEAGGTGIAGRTGEMGGTGIAGDAGGARRRWGVLRARASLAFGVIGLALLSLLLAGAAAIAVSRGFERERLVARLEASLGDALATPVRIESLSGPLYPDLALHGVRIGPEAQPLAEIERLSVTLDARGVLSGGPLVVETVELDGLALHLAADAAGRWNLPETPASDDPGESRLFPALVPPVVVRTARIVGSRVTVESEEWKQQQSGALPARFEAALAAEAQEVVFDAAGYAGMLPPLSQAKLDLVLEPSPLGAGRVQEGVVHLDVDAEQRLDFDVRMQGSFGRISARGAGDLDTLFTSVETRLDVAFEELDLGALTGDPAQQTRLTGKSELRIGAAAEGTADASPAVPSKAVPSRAVPSAAGSSVENAGAAGAAQRDIHVDLVLAASRVSHIDLARGRLRATLAGVPENVFVKVEELELHGDGVAVSARGSGSAEALDDVEISARIERLDRLSAWLDARELSAGASAGAAAGTVTRAAAGTVTRAAAGTVTSAAAGTFTGTAAGSGPQLAGSLAVHAKLSGPVGRAGGRVEITGRGLVFDALAVGDVDLACRVADGRRATIERFDVVGGRLDVTADAGGVVTLRAPSEPGSRTLPVLLEDLRLHALGAAITLDGAVGANEARALRVRVAHLDPARLAPEINAAQVTAGVLEAELEIDGLYAAPRLAGFIALSAGAVHVAVLDETLSPIAGRLRFEPGALVVERLSIGPPGESANITGRVALSGLAPGALDLRLAIADLSLSRVPLPNASRAETEGFELHGRVNADLHLTGEIAAPRLAGDLEWTQPHWESVELDRIVAHIAGDPGEIGGSLRLDYLGRQILAAKFALPVPATPGEPIAWLHSRDAQIEVRGEALEFALLEPFLTRLVRDPRGTADLELTVTGGLPEPRIEGFLRVQDGSIRAPLLRQTFEPVSGIVHFDGHRIVLEAFAVGPPEAGLRASGALELEDLRPTRIDVDFALSNFPLSRSSLFRTDVNGMLELAGTPLAPTLTGELALVDARLTLKSTADPVYKEVKIRSGAAPDEALQEAEVDTGPGLFDRAAVDITLRAPGGTWIRSPEMELDVQGFGHFEKRSLEEARMAGGFETLRGTVRVVGKKFRVRKGRVELDGAAATDPVLDVEAVHPVANVLVVAEVTGRLSAPILRLTSEPAMKEEEVLSYLFFGRPSSQLASSQQGGVELAAAGMAAGMALDELREIFGDAIPVDTIDLRMQAGDEPSRVEFGKYVTKDVFVRIGQSFGPETEQEVGVSYRINENWRIESSTSSNATAGADVFWTIDY